MQNYNSKNNYGTTQKSKSKVNDNASNPSFGITCHYWIRPDETRTYHWSAKLLKILNRTTSEMKDLAESFHNKSNDELREVTNEAHRWNSENARATEKVCLVDGKDKDIVEKAITLVTSRTNNSYEKLDCKGISNLSSSLAKSGEKSEELYNRTGKRTFLYLDNLEHTPQINDFITTASEKYHIIPVLNSQNNEIISSLNLPKNQIFKMNFWDKGQKAMVDSLEFMQERAKKNDFTHVSLERLQREIFNLIAAERSGMNPKIGNGILLHGPDHLTKITAEAIKNTVDANYIKIDFNKDKPIDIIDRIIDEAEKAEEIFKQTRKRTIIEAEGLDQMLTNKNSAEAMDNINEFKSIAEDLSERYHTIIIMRTDKPLEKFEAASIASNRLGMHIEVK